MGNQVRIQYKESVDSSIIEQFIQDRVSGQGLGYQWDSNVKELVISDSVYVQVVEYIDFDLVQYCQVSPDSSEASIVEEPVISSDVVVVGEV